MINTKKSGQVRYLIFQEADGGFCAVCLDFDIIEWGTDENELTKSIKEAASSYLQGVIKSNLPDELLNRPAPAQYWKMLDNKTRHEASKPGAVGKSSLLSFFGFESRPYHDSFNFA